MFFKNFAVYESHYSVELWKVHKYNRKIIQDWSLYFVEDSSEAYHADLSLDH